MEPAGDIPAVPNSSAAPLVGPAGAPVAPVAPATQPSSCSAPPPRAVTLLLRTPPGLPAAVLPLAPPSRHPVATLASRRRPPACSTCRPACPLPSSGKRREEKEIREGDAMREWVEEKKREGLVNDKWVPYELEDMGTQIWLCRSAHSHRVDFLFGGSVRVSEDVRENRAGAGSPRVVRGQGV
ncbi:hypothetical protein BRADI_4g02963v3 [Brachypodium distachyon]|uniref:Uncharacterized protein n=1 Tax=Brachypodium distachyon TaxID=15368 RepID=A0A2K2CK65_BRADI|nr:hypothetical protein BRADI_4g02963v3 [Brachypodium distachyon]